MVLAHRLLEENRCTSFGRRRCVASIVAPFAFSHVDLDRVFKSHGFDKPHRSTEAAVASTNHARLQC